MNNNAPNLPNLIDPLFKKKIVQILNPPHKDYWKPVRSLFTIIYEDYIKTYSGVVFLLVLLLIFLIYRYRMVKLEKEDNELNQKSSLNSSPNSNSNSNPNSNLSLDQQIVNDFWKNYTMKISESVSAEPQMPQIQVQYQPPPTVPAYPVFPYGNGYLV